MLNVQDPQDSLKDECRKDNHCLNFKEELQRCTDRVTSKSKTTETCTQELFDLVHCIDHCVS